MVDLNTTTPENFAGSVGDVQSERFALCQTTLADICAIALDVRDMLRQLSGDDGAVSRVLERQIELMGAKADVALKASGSGGILESTDRWLLSPVGSMHAEKIWESTAAATAAPRG